MQFNRAQINIRSPDDSSRRVSTVNVIRKIQCKLGSFQYPIKFYSVVTDDVLYGTAIRTTTKYISNNAATNCICEGVMILQLIQDRHIMTCL